MFVYCVVPFALMLLANVLLLNQISRKRRSSGLVQQQKGNKRSLTALTLVTTLSFIVLTAPNAVVNGFYLHDLFKTKFGTMLVFLIDSILFTYHGFNFLTLMLTNRRFMNQICAMVSRKSASSFNLSTKSGN